MPKRRISDIGVPIVLFIGTLGVYISNLCPSLWLMDSGEFVFHASVLGIPHPTGYPLYIQLGKFMTFLPGLDAPLAINLFSAIMASLTVAFLYRIIYMLEKRMLVSATAALLFGFSLTFWWQAEIAEVYSLHTFFLVWMTYLLLRVRETGDLRAFLLLSFVLGLSFTHHMSTVLITPAILYFVWTFRRSEVLSFRIIVPAFILFLVGLSVYLFIPLRAGLPPPFNYPQLHGVDPGKLTGLFWLVTGRIVKADMFQYGMGEMDKPITYYLVIMARDFLYIGIPIGIYGAMVQYKRDLRIFITFLLAFLAYVVFFINYGVVDQYVFFIPSFLFWSIWVGVGLSDLNRRIISFKGTGGKGTVLIGSFSASMVLLVALSIITDYRQLDFTNKREPEEFTQRVLDHVEDNALITSIYEATPLLWYHHYVSGMKPSVEIHDRGLMSLNVREEMLDSFDFRSPLFEVVVGRVFKERLEDFMIEKAGARPCYLVRYDSFLNDRFVLDEIEKGFYRIALKPVPAYHEGEIPDIDFPGTYRYKEQLDLFGLDLDRASLTEGDLFRVRIFWAVVKPLKDDFIALLRFVQGRELEEHELEENSFIGIYTLGGGMIPYDVIVSGRVIADEFDCMVPPDTRGGTYRVSLAFIEREQFYAVPKEELILDYLDLGTIPVRELAGLRHYWE
jgi:hypothetical protein